MKRIVQFLGFTLGIVEAVSAATPALKVGYLEYPPYAYRDPQGQMHGFTYEMLEGAARSAGIRLQWRYSPEGPETGLEKKNFDIWFGGVPTPERVARFHFTRPYWQTDWLLLVDRKLNIRSLEEVAGRSISVQDFSVNRMLFSKKLSFAKPHYFVKPDDVMASICRGETAGMFGDINYLHLFLLLRPSSCREMDFRFVTVPGAVLEVSLMTRPEAAAMADQIRDGIDKLAMSGETTEIITKYLAGASGGTKFLVRAVERYRARMSLYWGLSVATLLLAAMGIFTFVLRRKNQMISLALAGAQEASRVKSQFVANMSHELRTPMNGVLGMLELMGSSPLNAEQSEYVRAARVCSESLLGVLNDILELSKLRSGKPGVDIARFSIETVIAEAVTLCDPSLQAKPGLHITIGFEAGSPVYFDGDAKKIRQVLGNLLTNACKFTEQGTVLISVRHEDRWLRLAVVDSGIGIAKESQATIFEEFQQADTTDTRKYGGAGLGLSLSKILVEAMGGEIGVISEPGKGSEFWFRIPAEADGGGAHPWAPFGRGRRIWIGMQSDYARATLERYLTAWGFECVPFGEGLPGDRIFVDHAWASANRSNLFNVPLERVTLLGRASDRQFWSTAGIRILNLAFTPSALRHEVQQTASADMEAPKQQVLRRRILLVEDNPINRRVAHGMLKKLGCEIEVAENGEVAVEMVRRGEYDLIFMDCQMPVMDGYEATRRIRKQEPQEHRALIIALTANGLREDVERCLAAGMNSHLAKPVSLDALQKALSCDTSDLPASFSVR